MQAPLALTSPNLVTFARVRSIRSARGGALSGDARQALRRNPRGKLPSRTGDQPEAALEAMPRGRHEPARCRRRSLDLGAVQERAYRRQDRDARAAARLGLELGDHPREVFPVRQDAAKRPTSSSRCSGRGNRWKSSIRRSAQRRNIGMAALFVAGDARMEAHDRARADRASRLPGVQLSDREGHGRDHLARDGAARTPA